jgi:predicted RNase H-like HicB family nuclease
MKKFLVIFEKTKSGYSAYVPNLPGCVATGSNKTETEENIYSAIKFHLEGLKIENEVIPELECESELMVFS